MSRFTDYLERIRREEDLAIKQENGTAFDDEIVEYDRIVEDNIKDFNHFNTLFNMVSDEFITVNAGLNKHSQEYAMAEEVLMVANDIMEVDLNGVQLNNAVNSILNDDSFNEFWNESCHDAITTELEYTEACLKDDEIAYNKEFGDDL
jgi:uncharacterized protein YpuA (DUF1002 family)